MGLPQYRSCVSDRYGYVYPVDVCSTMTLDVRMFQDSNPFRHLCISDLKNGSKFHAARGPQINQTETLDKGYPRRSILVGVGCLGPKVCVLSVP